MLVRQSQRHLLGLPLVRLDSISCPSAKTSMQKLQTKRYSCHMNLGDPWRQNSALPPMLSGKQILCIMHECQDFFVVQPEIPVPVVITAYSDKTFTYVSNTLSIISMTDSVSGHCKVAQSSHTECHHDILTHPYLQCISTASFPPHACPLSECLSQQSIVECNLFLTCCLLAECRS